MMVELWDAQRYLVKGTGRYGVYHDLPQFSRKILGQYLELGQHSNLHYPSQSII
jgi:hypothetical protein